MPIARALQPDQDASRWDQHVAEYETAFETLTDAFGGQALDLLEPLEGAALLDLAAGAGGAALQAARRGAHVTAVDAAPGMVARIRERARGAGLGTVSGRVMDGTALDLPAGAFDAALSSFGVVLFADAARGMAELHRVLRPGGRVAVVTWTDPHRYELAARLREAIVAVRGVPPVMGELPAQLRFTEPALLHALVADAGFTDVRIETAEAALLAASAAALASTLGFAPGMTAMLDALGPDRAAVMQAFVERLQTDQGTGNVALGAVAHIAVATRA